MDDQASKDEKYAAIAATSELGSDDEPYREPSEAEKKLIRQINRNKSAEKRIAAMDVELTNVPATAQTFMVDWIINNVLTQAQREDLGLAWAIHYGEILTDMEGKAREFKMAHDRAKLGVQTPGLIIPAGVRSQDRG